MQDRASTLILVACTVWADDHIAILATAAVAAVRRAGIHLKWDRRTPQAIGTVLWHNKFLTKSLAQKTEVPFLQT